MSGEISTRCTRRGNHGWQCKRLAEPPFKHCVTCRTNGARSKKLRRANDKAHCILCGRDSFIRRVCYTCTAVKAEARHPEMVHDTKEHVRMLKARHKPYSRCQASGISAFSLAKMGEILTVDRINPHRGYVRGNMQLLARYLNSAKGVQHKVPRAAVKRLRRRMVRFAHDKLSSSSV